MMWLDVCPISYRKRLDRLLNNLGYRLLDDRWVDNFSIEIGEKKCIGTLFHLSKVSVFGSKVGGMKGVKK